MLDEISERIRQQVLTDIDASRDMEDEEIWDIISKIASDEVKKEKISLKERIELEKRIFDSLKRLDVLQNLIDDTDVTEIMVNGPDKIFYEKYERNII